MLDEHYPRRRLERSTRGWIERQTVNHAGAVLFTTPSARAHFVEKYGCVAAEKSVVVLNGFDERDFTGAEASQGNASAADCLTLLHSGVLYRDVRNPTCLFAALRTLKSAGELDAAKLRVRLRACGPTEHYRKMVADFGIEDLIELPASIPYKQALAEMLTADGLLLLQGRAANRQIPAKLFEYLRSGRPILGLLDREGDTAKVLTDAGLQGTAQIDSEQEILALLRTFLHNPDQRVAMAAGLDTAQRFSRRAAAAALSKVLDDVSGNKKEYHSG